jgi:hypothetical protein
MFPSARCGGGCVRLARAEARAAFPGHRRDQAARGVLAGQRRGGSLGAGRGGGRRPGCAEPVDPAARGGPGCAGRGPGGPGRRGACPPGARRVPPAPGDAPQRGSGGRARGGSGGSRSRRPAGEAVGGSWTPARTRCAGRAVTPGAPSRESILAALRAAVTIEVPCGSPGGLPEYVRIDRGKDFLAASPGDRQDDPGPARQSRSNSCSTPRAP